MSCIEICWCTPVLGSTEHFLGIKIYHLNELLSEIIPTENVTIVSVIKNVPKKTGKSKLIQFKIMNLGQFKGPRKIKPIIVKL